MPDWAFRWLVLPLTQKIFVDKLAKYLKLSDIFLDIATDETMAGGGKGIAIHYLINEMEKKGNQSA